MINRLNTTRTLLLMLLLILALAACGPAESEDEELASLTAVAEESVAEPGDESSPGSSEETASEPVEETASGTSEETASEPVEESASVPGDSTVSFDLYGGIDAGDYNTTDSGLQYYFIEEGEGEVAQTGQMLMVNIVGWMEDGTEITNSAAFGGPVPLPVGVSSGLTGLDEALTLLNAGSNTRIILSGDLMGGPDGAPSPLPPGDVAFELEVVEIIDGPPEAPQAVDDADYTVTESGLKFYDFEVGDGPVVESGQQVSVEYTGWLEDGTLFDSSVGRAPFVLVVGSGSVIQGWDEGLQGMQVGGRRQLVIPAELGYGESGGGPIPPGSTLIFEVEVVEAQ